MARFKDIWFDEMVERASELEDEGLSADEAYERAGVEAFDLASDRLADMADRARDRAKEARHG